MDEFVPSLEGCSNRRWLIHCKNLEVTEKRQVPVLTKILSYYINDIDLMFRYSRGQYSIGQLKDSLVVRMDPDNCIVLGIRYKKFLPHQSSCTIRFLETVYHPPPGK